MLQCRAEDTQGKGDLFKILFSSWQLLTKNGSGDVVIMVLV